METIKIIHISDLHISEHLLRDPDRYFKAPHRYGHQVEVFLALDDFLKTNNWDVLVITGDISRIGNSESFTIVRNWLNNSIDVENIRVGLELSSDNSKLCVMVPGNHDRFNGSLTQGKLDKFNREFGEIKNNKVVTTTIKGKTLNFHLFDSTWENGGFGYGKINTSSLYPRKLIQDEYDFAVMHHHFFQPPKHKRSAELELVNSSEVALYILNTGFNGVLFGHTHQSYIGMPSIKVLSSMLKDKRQFSRYWKKIMPKSILRRFYNNNCLVSYKKETTKGGQYPTSESYFNYIYLKQKKVGVLPPSEFDNAIQFHQHIRKTMDNDSFAHIVDEIKSKTILVSLAPSACQAEAKWHGFHEIKIDNNGSISYDRYQYDGAKFRLKNRYEHIS